MPRFILLVRLHDHHESHFLYLPICETYGLWLSARVAAAPPNARDSVSELK
jgi:hypothetical protein